MLGSRPIEQYLRRELLSIPIIAAAEFIRRRAVDKS